MESYRKKIEEILEMSDWQLVEYLRETDHSLQPTDTIQITPFKNGKKITYHHKDLAKPYKTRVYLKDAENSDLK